MLTKPVAALSMGATGRLVAAADSSGNVAMWETESRSAAATVRRDGAVKALAFGPDDETLFIAVGKGIEVWTVAALKK